MEMDKYTEIAIWLTVVFLFLCGTRFGVWGWLVGEYSIYLTAKYFQYLDTI